MSGIKGRVGTTASSSKVLRRLASLLGSEEVSIFAGITKKATYEDGTSVASVFWILEHGTNDGRIPARPVLKYTSSEQKVKWIRLCGKLLSKGMSPEQVAKKIGEVMMGDIKTSISKSGEVFEPNAPSTEKAKGFNAPLVRTGHLLRNINYVVKKGKEK